jgi:hypothetical protein
VNQDLTHVQRIEEMNDGRAQLSANPRRVLSTVFARASRQLGGGIIAGNSIILLLAWRAGAVTPDLLVALVIMSAIMALRVQPTEARRQG